MADDGEFPLTWPVDYGQCGTCQPFEDEQHGDETRAKFEDMAKWFLWSWTKRMFGTTTSVLRPDEDCDRAPTYVQLPPVLTWPLVCGRCKQCGCSCDSLTVLWISTPVEEVTRIVIEGVELDSSAYRLEGSHRVVRTDGESWPDFQDGSVTMDDPDGWGIEVVVGSTVPTGGRIAAGILACELAKAACNDKDCKLPQRVQSITRQGVAMTMLDDFEGLQKGRTGIWLIDSWVASINDVPMSATVTNPDLWLAGRTTQPMTRRMR